MALAFAGIPKHVSWLFTVLCGCQFLLFMQMNRQLFTIGNSTNYAYSKGRQSHKLHGNDGDLANADVISANNSPPKEKIDYSPQWQPLQKYRFRSRRAHQIVSEDYMMNNIDWGDYDESLYYQDYNITYLINQPHACSVTTDEEGDRSPFLLVLVHSHPSHNAQRDAIRDTWGKIRKDFDAPLQVRLVFILGLSESDTTLTRPKRESKLYRDIVVGTFMDSYRNLTLKSIFGLQWAKGYCSEAKYILKTDDDTYFNLTMLLEHLPLLRNTSLLGSLNTNAPVQRQGLWQVRQEQFPQQTYPPYCSGCAYVINQDILSSLLRASETIEILPIEDVYVTGLLAHALGAQCKHTTHFPYWYMGPSPKHICLLLNRRIYGLHNVPYERMYTIYNKMISGHRCDGVLR